MIQEITKFLKQNSNYRDRDILKPRVTKNEDLGIPKHSVFYNGFDRISGNEEWLQKQKDVHMYIRSDYSGVLMCDKFKRLTINDYKLIEQHQVEGSVLKFIAGRSKLETLKSNDKLILDYTDLPVVHSYTGDKPNATTKVDTCKIYNSLSTMVTDINTHEYSDLLPVLLLPLPKRFPTKTLLTKLKNNNNFHKYSRDVGLFSMVEVVKCVAGETSIFDIIEDIGTSNLVIAVKGDTGYIFIRLITLLALNNENEHQVKYITGHGSNEAQRMVIQFFKKCKELLDKVDEVIEEDDVFIEKIVEDFEDESVEIIIDENEEQITTSTFSRLERTGVSKKDFINKHGDLIKQNLDKIKKNTTTKEERQIEEVDTPKLRTVLDDSFNKNTLKATDKKFNTKIYKKHQEAVFNSFVKGGVVLKSHEVEINEDIGNAMELHKLTFIRPDGGTNAIPLYVPKLNKDGGFINAGNKYMKSKLKLDAPIKKIGILDVSLRSYYGKIFISKGESSRHNSSKSILKMLKTYNDSKDIPIDSVVEGTTKIYDEKLPKEYLLLSRDTVRVTYRTDKEVLKFHFDYIKEEKHTSKPLLKFGYPCGDVGKNKLIMDKTGSVSSYTLKGVKVKDYGNILSLLQIENYAPEHITSAINGSKVPIILPMALWKGFNSTLKTMGIKVSVKEKKDIDPLKETGVRFKDGWMVWSTEDIVAELTLGGLRTMLKTTKEINTNELKSRSGVISLLSHFGNNRLVARIDTLYSLFIDPMTKEVLEEMGEPTTIPLLFKRSIELLTDDNCKDPSRVDTFIIVGNDIINGMIYNAMTKMITTYNGQIGMRKSRLEVHPYEVVQYLNSDSTYGLVEDNNPLEYNKHSFEVKSTGHFGRGKDGITMLDRYFHPDDTGIFSEVTKDDGNVGSTVALTADPSFKNAIGMPKVLENGKIGEGNGWSQNALLVPRIQNDDGKRILYRAIQDKHMVACKPYEVNPYRTGYESVFPYTVSDRYCVHAKEDGKVLSVRNGSALKVQYKSGEKQTITLTNDMTRAVSGKSYTHRRTTMLSKGDTFKKDDNLMYNEAFFAEDVMNPRRVAYKDSTITRVRITEDFDTYEDSSAICETFANSMITPVTYNESILLEVTNNITFTVNKGDKVKAGEPLLTFTNIEHDTTGLSKEAIAILNEQSNTSPTSPATGDVLDIVVYYNCEFKDLHKSMKKLAEESDVRLKARTGFTGRVKYGMSIGGKQLKENEVFIVYFVEKQLGVGAVDKFGVSTQLKTTIARVVPDIVTEKGNVIGMDFGDTSIAARIVDSPYAASLVLLNLEDIEKEVIKIRDGE